ncbi:MAG: YqgE/AlgH family protein, partial [Rhodospirillales bacterium]|nr:YqgE/AlgH family protein [Rhodospirillales bacterium]
GFGLKSEGAGGTFPLRFGGPVEQGRVFILYQEGSIAGGEDKEIKITADLEMLKSMARGEGPKRKLILLGYAGWGAGQLESEIASDDWVTAPLDADLVFAPDDAPKWDAAMKNAGRLL